MAFDHAESSSASGTCPSIAVAAATAALTSRGACSAKQNDSWAIRDDLQKAGFLRTDELEAQELHGP
jgi:hypothetical protein